MQPIDPTAPAPPPPPERPSNFGPPWLLPVLGAAAVLVLLVGVLVWAASRGDDDDDAADATTVPPSSTTTPPTTTTTTTATTTTTTTSTTTTTTTTTTEPPTTTSTVPAGPSGSVWTVTSPYFPDHPFTLRRVADAGDGRLAAYDGSIDPDGPDAPGVRCVAVTVEARDGWQEWCGDADHPARFVVLDGIDPWLVELGPNHGEVTFARQPPEWSLPTNGCAAPVAALVDAAALPAAMTGLVCAGGEAFATFGQVLLQDGPGDGAGVLLDQGPEGWNVADMGTSIPCAPRCDEWGAQDELFEAVLPIPPAAALPDPGAGVVAVADDTAHIRTIVRDQTDPDGIDAIIVTELAQTGEGGEPSVARATDLSGHTLLVVDVPAHDDAGRSTAWGIWIATDPGRVTRATTWSTCARGVADDRCA